MGRKVFKESVRGRGDLAGVFEHDGETSYFYLVDFKTTKGMKIVDAIHIATGPLPFRDAQIEIRWSTAEDRTGLFLAGTQWAVFNVVQGTKFGGGYSTERAPDIPESEQLSLGKSH